MPSSSLRTLGTFEFHVGETAAPPPPTIKARVLLAYLVMHRGVDVSRERLIDVLWPESDAVSGRTSLNTALYSIRRSFRLAKLDPEKFLRASKASLRWIADTRTDVEEIEALASSRNAAIPAHLHDLYSGDFLEGCYDDWAISVRERVSALFDEQLSRAVRQTGEAALARKLIARSAYDEAAYATAIDAEVQSGRFVGAAELIDRYRSSLAEFGEKPSAEFEARYAHIRHQAIAADREFHFAFSGRFAELSQIERAASDARDGIGRLILVHGEPGIGKSTLLQRAAEIAKNAGLKTAVVRCIVADPRPFGPWGHAYEAWTGKDFSAVVQAESDAPENTIAALMVRALESPSAIFIDDAQWLEGNALEVLQRLASLSVASAHVVVCATRPEGCAALRGRLADIKILEMPLAPLSKSELERGLELSKVRAGSRFGDVLYARTDGQPLFVVHVLGALAASGALRRDHQYWRLRERRERRLGVPSSLASAIKGRLQAVGEDAKPIAAALAVEPDATIGELAQACGTSEERVLDAIDRLLSLGVITQPDGAETFAFAHDYIREVAGELLSRPRRALLHLFFAGALQRRGDSGKEFSRARHLEAAGDRIGAAAAYAAAARDAIEWQATATALERVEAGLRVLRDAERTAAVEAVVSQLKRHAANALGHAGDTDAAIAPATEAVEHARNAGDERLQAMAHITRSAYAGASNPRELLADAQSLYDIGKRLNDDVYVGGALARMAAAHVMLAHEREAMEAIDEALDLARRQNDVESMFYAGHMKLQAEVGFWRFAAALTTAQRLTQWGGRLGKNASATAMLDRAVLWIALERFDDAERDLDEAGRLMEEMRTGGLRDQRLGIASDLLVFLIALVRAMVKLELSRWDEALGARDEFERHRGTMRDPGFANAARFVVINALLGRGAPTDAQRAHEIARDIVDLPLAQSWDTWSNCRELSMFRAAARLRLPEAKETAEATLAVIERHAQQTPLTADAAFKQFAAAAREIGAEDLAARADQLSKDYRASRIAAAADAWGGK